MTNTGGGDDGLHAPLAGWWWWCWNANSGDTGGIVRSFLTRRKPRTESSQSEIDLLSVVYGLPPLAKALLMRTVKQTLTDIPVAGGAFSHMIRTGRTSGKFRLSAHAAAVCCV